MTHTTAAEVEAWRDALPRGEATAGEVNEIRSWLDAIAKTLRGYEAQHEPMDAWRRHWLNEWGPPKDQP